MQWNSNITLPADAFLYSQQLLINVLENVMRNKLLNIGQTLSAQWTTIRCPTGDQHLLFCQLYFGNILIGNSCLNKSTHQISHYIFHFPSWLLTIYTTFEQQWKKKCSSVNFRSFVLCFTAQKLEFLPLYCHTLTPPCIFSVVNNYSKLHTKWSKLNWTQ